MAIDCYQQALELARSMGNRNYEYEALLGLGASWLAGGEPGSALTHHQAALALAGTLGQPTDEARAHKRMAMAQRALGDYAQAVHSGRCRTLLDELGLTEIGEFDADMVRSGLADLPAEADPR